jgi:hypothetical protein
MIGNATVGGVLVAAPKTPQQRATIRLQAGARIQGDIRFEEGQGVVIQEPGSEIQGTVIGGEVRTPIIGGEIRKPALGAWARVRQWLTGNKPA